MKPLDRTLAWQRVARSAAVLAVATGLLALPATAEITTVEAVGVVPLRDDQPLRRPPREMAEELALASAVRQVAEDQLRNYDPERDAELLDAALGKRPLDYVSGYRTLEDRGERAALFSEDPEVDNEYVVLVEVKVEAGRLRERLGRSGLLAATQHGDRRHRVRIVLEDVETWASYRAVATLLEDLGVQSAVPVEMVRGRAVMDVQGSRSPDALMAALVRAAPPNLRLVPLGTEGDTLRLRANFLGSPASPDDASRAD